MSQTDGKYDFTYTQNRELSWLSFNSRVLEEASDTDVPLIERLRFVSIFTTNLDEFFMIRVGSLLDLSLMVPKYRENKSNSTSEKQLELIFKAVKPMIEERDAIYSEISGLLRRNGIFCKRYEDLEDNELSFIRKYYKENIKPILSPQIINRSHPFPHLKNKALYVAGILKEKGHETLGIIEVPENIPPIIFLPGKNCEFILTETIILAHFKKIFKIYTVEEPAIISVTRNADIRYDDEKFDEDNPDFRNHMSKMLKLRDRLAPVRLEIQGDAPQLNNILCDMLRLNKEQSYSFSCPINLTWSYMLKNLGNALYYPAHEPVWPNYLSKDVPIIDQIRQRDILLFYPFHSINPFIQLLSQSASDPSVLSIKITIYRLAKNSDVVKQLCKAAENGKEVTVLVELRARFDERENIEWARTLEDYGCKIIYGSENYKCHSKICLITKRDKNSLVYITQIGTGNYNEKTAELYTDFCLMTANEAIGNDAVAFFQNMLIDNLYGSYDKLLVAPNSMKSVLQRLIDGEISKGAQGKIIIKANSITERDLIDKLSCASQAGVKIDLIIRGICCIIPGVTGKTENITVTRIVGRFLEHSRIYSFGDGDDSKIYISSADIMTRNQTRRVEIACPIESSELKDWFLNHLRLLLSDNIKARQMLPNSTYIRIPHYGSGINEQQYYIDNPPEFSPTIFPKKSIFDKLISKLTHIFKKG